MALENESYVLNLCDEALGSKGRRQHIFDWLTGDASPKTGLRKALPVDAYWPNLSLVVEFHEKQHSEAVKHFDKPNVSRESIEGCNAASTMTGGANSSLLAGSHSS